MINFLLKRSLVKTLKVKMSIDLDIKKLKFNTVHVEGSLFKIDTNINALISISSIKLREIVQTASLGISKANIRLQSMKYFNAMATFREDELDLLNNKLHFLNKNVMPETPQDTFRRVISVSKCQILNNL